MIVRVSKHQRFIFAHRVIGISIIIVSVVTGNYNVNEQTKFLANFAKTFDCRSRFFDGKSGNLGNETMKHIYNQQAALFICCLGYLYPICVRNPIYS